MALSKTKLVRDDAPIGSSNRALIIRYNELCNMVWDLATKLDADAANTALNDTDYAATVEAGVSLISTPGGDAEITA